LWWGHRIPAWHCRNCHTITVARETPATCPQCHSTELEQDSDVLDTWFSSGLWPFSTLGWPDNTADLRTFYPTSLLITGFDILFFWVSRMITLGIEMTGEVPFREVHMHGLVRDAEGKKMSKTKGNVVDPLQIMDQFGTDACRIGLLLSAAPGSDIALKEDRLESSRGFANKLWNASRLLFMNIERSRVSTWRRGEFPSTYIEDAWIHAGLNRTIRTVTEALGQHRYHEAAHEIWHFVWHEFCDWYLEVKKLRFSEGSGEDQHWTAALNVYETTLRLLHPFMPFVTEELWQRLVQALPAPGHARSISLEAYPTALPAGQEDERPFVLLRDVVKGAREQRAGRKLDLKTEFPTVLKLKTHSFSAEDLALISKLTRLSLKQEPGPDLETAFELRIEAKTAGEDGALSADARARIEKENVTLQRNIDNTSRQLNDPTFTGKAPEHIVTGMREKLAAYQAQLENNRKSLEAHV
jgi:valyl-tRNA synthetase